MSGKPHRPTADEQSRQQQQKEASENAKEAKAKHNQPADIAERTLMQRQSKHMHQQDGK